MSSNKNRPRIHPLQFVHEGKLVKTPHTQRTFNLAAQQIMNVPNKKHRSTVGYGFGAGDVIITAPTDIPNNALALGAEILTLGSETLTLGA